MNLRSDGYPENWLQVSYAVKAAAGWRCIRCGHPAEAPGPSRRKSCDEFCDLRRHPEVDDFPDRLSLTHSPQAATIRDGRMKSPPSWPLQRQRVLTVHHLDGDKANLAWWNLAALCQVCHLSIQGRVQMGQEFMFEHSVWFKPYVAGYYAFKYLGRELSRREVEAQMENLLALPMNVSVVISTNGR